MGILGRLKLVVGRAEVNSMAGRAIGLGNGSITLAAGPSLDRRDAGKVSAPLFRLRDQS